jgi:hypothetical protein
VKAQLLRFSRVVVHILNGLRYASRTALLLCCALAVLPISTLGQETNSTAVPQTQYAAATPSGDAAAPESLDKVIDRVVEGQHLFIAEMRQFHPLVETYIQNLQRRKHADAEPVSDEYFLGRLKLTDRLNDRTLLGQTDLSHRVLSKLPALYRLEFLPLGFAQMALLDDDFQRKDYTFRFLGRGYVGEIRCLVLDVAPKKDSGTGRFLGRIWVEDQDYNIVRFEGTYTPRPRFGYYVHFDSWRQNLQPGIWLPSYIYSEELPLRHGLDRKLRLKAQTRLWAYEPDQLKRIQEFTRITVESSEVTDQAEAPRESAPVEGQRQWESEAEENAIEQLEKVGLMAPPGDAEKVPEIVVHNLLASNGLRIEPEVRIRVLLISPLQSFTIGHTIVVSRGLLDVVPDEASLAVILAHELGHIALGHNLDTKFAFNDRMFFPDEDTFQRLNFLHSAKDEDAADKKALALLANSPYKDDLTNARSFLQAVRTCAPQLKSLIRPHLGESIANLQLPAATSDETGNHRETAVATLSLGTRIKLNPWSNRIESMDGKAVASSGERIAPFELTPSPPDLTWYTGSVSAKVAAKVQDH